VLGGLPLDARAHAVVATRWMVSNGYLDPGTFFRRRRRLNRSTVDNQVILHVSQRYVPPQNTHFTLSDLTHLLAHHTSTAHHTAARPPWHSLPSTCPAQTLVPCSCSTSDLSLKPCRFVDGSLSLVFVLYLCLLSSKRQHRLGLNGEVSLVLILEWEALSLSCQYFRY